MRAPNTLTKHPLRFWVLAMALVGVSAFLTASRVIAESDVRPTETPEEISQKLLELNTRREATNSLKNHDAAFRRQVTKFLIQAANEGNSSRRQNAIFALRQVGPDAEEAMPLLKDVFLADKDGLGHSAADALGKIGAPAAPILVEQLRNPAFRSPLSLARVVDDMAPVPPELLPSLVEALRIYTSIEGSRAPTPAAEGSALRRALERFDSNAHALEVAGHVASAIAKTDPGCVEAVPLIKQGHDRTWNPIVNQGLAEALERMTSPEAKSLAWKLRAKRRLFIFIFHAPFLILYGWLIYRMYRWIFRRGVVLRYVLIPVAQYFLYLYISLLGLLGDEFSKSFSSPGVAITHGIGLALYSPFTIMLIAPVYFSVLSLTLALLGLIPWLRKSRPLGLFERGFCVVMIILFLLLVGWMIWARRFCLNIPPPI